METDWPSCWPNVEIVATATPGTWTCSWGPRTRGAAGFGSSAEGVGWVVVSSDIGGLDFCGTHPNQLGWGTQFGVERTFQDNAPRSGIWFVQVAARRRRVDLAADFKLSQTASRLQNRKSQSVGSRSSMPGAEAPNIFTSFAARLKSCPDTIRDEIQMNLRGSKSSRASQQGSGVPGS